MNLFQIEESYKTLKEKYNALPKTEREKDENIKKKKYIDAVEKVMNNFVRGDYEDGRISFKEAITTTDSIKLVPRIIEEKLREAAEPQYLGTKFMTKITVNGTNTSVYEIPIVGEIIASEVQEGGTYNEDYVDVSVLEQSSIQVKVRKVGVKVSITEEAMADSSWDLLSMNIRKMGQAMGRYKEELIFNNFTAHGHEFFNNRRRSQHPELGTHGRDKSGQFNNTVAVEDIFDMVLALMSNNCVPTDVIMHPLTWLIFAKNGMIGNGMTYGAFGGSQVHPWGAVQGTQGFAGLAANGEGQKLIMTPDQVQNRLPVPITMNFSPFVHFDKVNKLFDMYCIDRTQVGIIAQREELSTTEWKDPERDLKNLKCKERYGVAVINNGRGIITAKNLAVDTTYPEPPVVKIVTDK